MSNEDQQRLERGGGHPPGRGIFRGRARSLRGPCAGSLRGSLRRGTLRGLRGLRDLERLVRGLLAAA
jgi:hypothetical protein